MAAVGATAGVTWNAHCAGESDGSGAIPAEWERQRQREVLNATASQWVISAQQTLLCADCPPDSRFSDNGTALNVIE